MSLRSQLSHLLPVATAVSVLGEDRVTRIVAALLRLQLANHSSSNGGGGGGGKSNGPIDAESSRGIGIAQAAALLEEDASDFVQSMLYTTNTAASAKGGGGGGLGFPSGSSKAPPQSPSQSNINIPPPIREAWKKLQSRPLLLDKATLIKFLVPACAQPNVGPGGHMGLFDCLAHALQLKPAVATTGPLSASSSGMNGSTPLGEGEGSPLVAIPDVVIYLAICQNYWELQNDANGEDAIVSYSSDHPTIIIMSRWMFLVYDGYHKKGLVVRDTMHRFLSDIHGEESYKTPGIRDLLDKFFAKGAQLTAREFVLAITDTLSYSPQPSHVLLDWMASLAHAIQPLPMEPESTQVFLQTIDQQSRGLTQICDHHHLAEYRLYEIKRRFHSLVETTTTVIQGNPMSVEEQQLSSATMTDNNANNSQSTVTQVPKHVIPLAAFLQAVCHPSDEQGHGGFLPESLAARVFEGVVRMTHSKEHDWTIVDEASTSLSSLSASKVFWNLPHVLQFGGLCVRSSEEDYQSLLIQWIVQQLLSSSSTHDITTQKVKELDDHLLSNLMELLCEHMAFRLAVDKPLLDDTERCDDANDTTNGKATVTVESALALGLLPKNFDDTQDTVEVQVLVDELKESLKVSGDLVSVEQLVRWHRETPKEQSAQQRMGAFVTELRIIAGVVFGVPPKLASMELAIVTEIQRRHKCRYPQTAVSRRGPRGTMWYIIDDAWYRSWNGIVDKVSFTVEDGQDLRDKDSEMASPRRLGKISNRGLLRDGGSLALRVDIKWRHDYEIVPPLTWSALQAWYDGGPPVHRSVVPYTPSGGAAPHNNRKSPSMRTENEIELYPFFVTMFLCDATSRGEARPFQQGVPLSRVSPVRVLLVQLCKGLDVNPDLGRLWVVESTEVDDHTSKGQGDWRLDLDVNIVEQRKNRVGLDQSGGSTINLLLELKDKESGLWPRGEDGKTWSFSKTDDNTIDTGDGVVGLYNMGNTCYLNSSIQCLSHTPIFRDYFTAKCYLKDINTTNPLGHQGHLAQVSAVLINSLWKRFNQHMPHQPKRVTAPGSYAPVSAPALTPKTFKESLGKFNEHFSGNEQHDAQELLAFLLGGLSEDLNRIVEKPYIQAPDSDGRPDSELADIWWSNHLKREMSIIVALFTGQYKSLLKCKTCQYESARFEPFTFLQVPLPEDDTIPVNLVVYPSRIGADTLKYSVRVHNNGTLYDVLISLSKVMHADEEGDDGEAKSDSPNESQNDVGKEKLNGICAKRAMNMAVVDMREGYIFKIAPNAWRLPDLQNKDTGELPLLHVYELDSMPEAEEKQATAENDGAGDEEKALEDELRTRCSFLALAQRKTELLAQEVLHPLTHKTFGTPLLLRVADMDGMAGKEIYDRIAKHLRNFVPSSALKFLQNESGSSDSSLREVAPVDQDGRTKFELRQRLQKTMTDMEEVAAGPVPRYGFRLRLASRDGRRCALCPWYDCCIGCLVPDDDAPNIVMNGDSLAIDWHFAVDVATNGFGTRSSQGENTSQQPSQRGRTSGVSIKNHSSCGIGKKNGPAGAITLEDCLDAFAQEEKIPEAYCSSCKDFRIQTKRMSLWRLPPVVIIHLKRFQFTQHMRRKLRDFVNFPVEGLDLSRIMATDSADGSPNEEKETQTKAQENGDSPSHETGEKTTDQNGKNKDVTKIDDPNGEASRLNQDDGRGEMLYDLYGVVHHQGALSGGHYVASLKSEADGQWRLFNDAQIYEIHSRDVVDSSAYILFYIRRDVKDLKLEDFWNTEPAREGEGLTEEEMEKLIRGRSDRCVIS